MSAHLREISLERIQFLIGCIGIIGEKRNCAHLRKKLYLDQVLMSILGKEKKCTQLRKIRYTLKG